MKNEKLPATKCLDLQFGACKSMI